MPLRDIIKPLDGSVTIRNESGHILPIVGTIYLAVHIGKIQATVTFLVAEKLAT